MPAMTSIDEARIQPSSCDDGNFDVDDSSLVEEASGGRRHKLRVATASFVGRRQGAKKTKLIGWRLFIVECCCFVF